MTNWLCRLTLFHYSPPYHGLYSYMAIDIVQRKLNANIQFTVEIPTTTMGRVNGSLNTCSYVWP